MQIVVFFYGCYNLLRTYMCAKSLQSCLILCDPMDCSPQAPLSMGFSRQEDWSGLTFPSPGDLPDPGIEPTSLVSPALAGKDYLPRVPPLCMLSHFSHVQLFVTPRTIVLQAHPSMGFPRQDTGVGCHFILQGIFLTQELNLGLLHCRQILYHLSHQGRPIKGICGIISVPHR